MATSGLGDSLDLREKGPPNSHLGPHQDNDRQEFRRQVPKFRLSQEEMRVLHECNRESFYYRCVPFGTAAMIATHFAVKAGYLQGSPKFGSFWKVLGAGLTGYFIGKFSYRSKCEEKIMRLPGSQLAETLRRRKQGLSAFPEIYTMESAYGGQGNPDPSIDHSQDSDPGGTWDIDEDKNIQFRGLSDSQRPTMDNSDSVRVSDEAPAQQTTNYELLRKQNHEEYEARRASIYQKKDHAPSGPRAPTRPEMPSENVSKFNQYGDVME